MLDLMKKHLAAYSQGKWEEYKAAFASNVTYEEVATRQIVKGVDNYIEFVKRWKKAFPDLKATVVGGFESGDEAVAEIEWEGTHGGPLEGAFGSIPPTNKRGKLRAVIVSSLKDGKIVSTRHYFDILSLLTQLGVAPMAGAGVEPSRTTATPPVRH